MKRIDVFETLCNLVDCYNCSCCDSGAVYVLSHELEGLRKKGIEVIDLYSAHFIPRKGGVCIYYNHSKKKCEIYPDRPLCCRIFPFDIIYSIDLGLWWAVFKKCQKIIEMLSEPIRRRAIKILLREFEASIEQKMLIDFYLKERATLIVERGEKLDEDYLLILPLKFKYPEILQRFIGEPNLSDLTAYQSLRIGSMPAFRLRIAL